MAQLRERLPDDVIGIRWAPGCVGISAAAEEISALAHAWREANGWSRRRSTCDFEAARCRKIYGQAANDPGATFGITRIDHPVLPKNAHVRELRNDAPLLLLEPMTRELQRPAVLGHCAHDIVRCPSRYLGVHLDRYRHRRPDQTGEVRDDFIRYSAGIAADAVCIEDCRAVEAFGSCSR